LIEKKKRNFIHGESYIDGVMYNDSEIISVSIRDSEGKVKSSVKNRISILKKHKKLDKFILRGIIDFYEGSVNQSIAEQHIKKMKNKKITKKTKMGHIFSVISIMLFGMILYFTIPTIITFFLQKQIQNLFLLNIIEIILRFGIFIFTFILLCSSKSVKKSSYYHGAEHKVFNCYFKGKQLTMDNIKNQSIYNPGCGTSFLILLIFISIPFMIFIPYTNLLLRIILIFALSPIWLGISLDLTVWLAKSNSIFSKIVGKPGLLLQRLNTKIPTDDHIEIALNSLKNLLEYKQKKSNS